MAQTLKPEMRSRIIEAALDEFSAKGYQRASIAEIARQAGTAPANIYRYFAGKQGLFDAAIPPSFAKQFNRVLDRRIIAPEVTTDGSRVTPEALRLLEFWVTFRRQVTIILDRSAGSPFADFAERYVDRLVRHAYRKLREQDPGVRISPHQRALLFILFDNTRRAIVAILGSDLDDDSARAMIRGFWTYQIPGLDGLFHGIIHGDRASVSMMRRGGNT
jgi:AcrR family transcriptional regulator